MLLIGRQEPVTAVWPTSCCHSLALLWFTCLMEALYHLVPSAHLGPYLGMFKLNGILWLLFGARAPEGTNISSPDLSRSELLVRLNALADDTRLRILQAIHEAGELCSQELMTQLDLSQSAASRHLKQLSATGYLTERRREGAKCYSLDPGRIEDVLTAMSSYLLS